MIFDNPGRTTRFRRSRAGHILFCLPLLLLAHATPAQEATEAAASCVVIHEADEADSERSITCFENIALERTSFEAGVCRWQTDEQVETSVETTTQFVEQCPDSFSGFCDRLVLGPGVVAPVRIYLYDKTDEVLERARKHCESGGGSWTVRAEETG